MSVSQDLSVLISQAQFRALPPDVVEVAKTVILDGLGVTLAGSVELPARIVAEYVQEMGGTPQCSVWGHRFKTSPVMAAFANGVAGHVLDYEVMWHPATHATSPTLPGILALAESQQRSGQEVITALVTAFEVQGRIRVASAKLDLRGFHPPGLVGVMGSAAAASVMLKLSAEQTRMALGIAASRAGGVSAKQSAVRPNIPPSLQRHRDLVRFLRNAWRVTLRTTLLRFLLTPSNPLSYTSAIFL